MRDVGSLNGTYVNRERIDEIALTDGDELQIGKFKLVFFAGRPRLTMTDRAYLSIGEVLALLQDEFPDVTISKIRFLESQGLLDPERTPSGYRKFYERDIERLRWILHEQRENFLPLKVIKDRLESGEPTPTPSRRSALAETPSVDSRSRCRGCRSRRGPVRPHRLPRDPRPAPGVAAPRPAGAGYTFDEIVVESGLDPAQLREVERYGLLGRAIGGPRDVLRRGHARGRQARCGVHAVRRRGAASAHVPHDRRARGGLRREVVMPLVKQRNPRRASRRSRPSRAAQAGRQHASGDAAPGAPRLHRSLTRCGPASSSTAGVRPSSRASAGDLGRLPDRARRRLVLVGVLKGSVVFLADLVRALTDRLRGRLPRRVVLRRGPGRMRLLKDLDIDIAGRDVVLVEDVVDTGLTLAYLLGELRRARAGVARGLHAARQAVPAHRAGAAALRRARRSTTRSCSATASTWPAATATST